MVVQLFVFLCPLNDQADWPQFRPLGQYVGSVLVVDVGLD